MNQMQITFAQRIRRVGDVPAYALVPPGTANYPSGIQLAFKSTSQPARVERAQALMRAGRQAEAEKELQEHQGSAEANGPGLGAAAFERSKYTQARVPFKLEQPDK